MSVFTTMLAAIGAAVLISTGDVVAQEHQAAAESHAVESRAVESRGQQETTAQPSLSQDPKWAGIAVIGVLGVFLLAIGAGIAGLEAPQASANSHAEDEHGHGHDDHGHGHGGH